MKKIFDFKTLIAIIGIIMPIVFFVLSKNVKELSFKNVAINELVSKKDITDESIKVYFDQERVFNLYSITCILSNTGNVPITGTDFTNRFIIQFPDSLKILKYSFKKNPESINITEKTLNGPTFIILPDLLNPNESIEFNFYVSSASSSLLPFSNSRIIGGEVLNLNMNEEIKSKTEFNNRAFLYFESLIFWIAFVYTILYTIMIFGIIYFQKSTGLESAIGKFFMFLLFSIGLFCNLFYLIQTRF